MGHRGEVGVPAPLLPHPAWGLRPPATAGHPPRYLGADGRALGCEQGADEGRLVGAVTLLPLQAGLRAALLQLEGAELTEVTCSHVAPPKVVTDLRRSAAGELRLRLPRFRPPEPLRRMSPH